MSTIPAFTNSLSGAPCRGHKLSQSSSDTYVTLFTRHLSKSGLKYSDFYIQENASLEPIWHRGSSISFGVGANPNRENVLEVASK